MRNIILAVAVCLAVVTQAIGCEQGGADGWVLGIVSGIKRVEKPLSTVYTIRVIDHDPDHSVPPILEMWTPGAPSIGEKGGAVTYATVGTREFATVVMVPDEPVLATYVKGGETGDRYTALDKFSVWHKGLRREDPDAASDLAGYLSDPDRLPRLDDDLEIYHSASRYDVFDLIFQPKDTTRTWVQLYGGLLIPPESPSVEKSSLRAFLASFNK